MSNRPRIGVLVLAALLGCGGGAPSRESARDQATTLTCQQFARCMDIGTGKTYPTADDCQIQWQGTWDGKWPAADCEGKINQDGFDTCMAAIRGTSCTLGDLVNTLGKCDKKFVCATGSADGG